MACIIPLPQTRGQGTQVSVGQSRHTNKNAHNTKIITVSFTPVNSGLKRTLDLLIPISHFSYLQAYLPRCSSRLKREPYPFEGGSNIQQHSPVEHLGGLRNVNMVIGSAGKRDAGLWTTPNRMFSSSIQGVTSLVSTGSIVQDMHRDLNIRRLLTHG